MPGLIGKKVGMTSVFSAEGKSIPCTVIEAGPCVVTQVKTIEKDGYTAIQLGFDDKKEKNTTKPLSGHFKKAGTTPKRKLVEFSGYDVEYKLGDVIDVNLFEGTEYVDVVGTRKRFPRCCETPWICRSRRGYSRSAQPSKKTGIYRCLFYTVTRVQRNAYGWANRW